MSAPAAGGGGPEIVVLPQPSGIEGFELREHFWIVVDVLRACTSIAHAFESGARGVVPVETVEEAMRLHATLGRESTVLAGERRSIRIEGFHLGNSPTEFRPETVADRTIVLATTNGARALAALDEARECVAGAFVNAGACATAAVASGAASIVVVCAGSAGRFALEDFLCAGLIVDRVREAARAAGRGEPRLDDGARTALASADASAGDLRAVLAATDHGRSLVELGFERDLALAAEIDRFDRVPALRDGRLTVDPRPAASPPR